MGFVVIYSTQLKFSIFRTFQTNEKENSALRKIAWSDVLITLWLLCTIFPIVAVGDIIAHQVGEDSIVSLLTVVFMSWNAREPIESTYFLAFFGFVICIPICLRIMMSFLNLAINIIREVRIDGNDS